MGVLYELKRFKNSNDGDLTKALNMYSQNIEPFLRTDTREIIYWLDKYPQKFNDQFIIFGLYLNNDLVGFAQIAYFIEQKIIFVDYIVILREFRKNNTFFEFVEEIRDYLVMKNFQFDYILAEVGGFDDNKEPTNATRNLIRLLKMTGFGVIKTNYYHPRLGKINYESELQSVLMLYTLNEIKTIKKETFFLFLDTIYFNHYKRWYDAFLDEKERAKYGSSLIKLKEKSEENLKKKDIIQINGYTNIYTSTASTSGQKSYEKFAKMLAVVILFIILLVSFGIIHTIVKNKYGIDVNAQLYIVLVSTFSLLFILLFIRESKTKSITSIIESVINKMKK
ncbi:hypothetical protein [Ferruginibacter albus]|uniref:hypothetical protein n=1 Tax=Ferruginibacter albus TaxID=2875540 RepID=UPI001CC4F1BA|nr:hypothetical protein [Ferruginibacter albus]UAY53232.1 hypothetical protein K9M53_06065 [Ferruginibacter albus]